ncbi:tyrosine-type recombinase/integrase [Photobacterium damselae]|uniref:tyrosine-type recombinase/integrase n=1 Tax=Photobacterium damselae TaxID=38293 RepID=UPI0011B28C66|nr:tyrosine-type recombinase/integrase [Photobacterium damselae]
MPNRYNHDKMNDALCTIPKGEEPSQSEDRYFFQIARFGHDQVRVPNAALRDLRLDPDDLEVEQISKAVERANELGIPIYEIPHMAAAVEMLLNNFLNNGANHRKRSLKRLNDGWKSFERFIRQHTKWGNQTYLPAKPAAVRDFIQSRHDDGIHRNTLKLEIWAIRAVHRATGMPDPTVARSVTNLIGKVITTQALDERFIKQAQALNYEAISILVKKWRLSGNLAERRNLAYIVAAYDGLFRYAEISNIKLDHIKPQDNGTLQVVLPITKTNHSGDADVVVLSATTRQVIEEYMQLGRFNYKPQNKNDYLFKGVSGWGSSLKDSGKPLAHNSVLTMLNSAYKVIYSGIDEDELPRKYTAHSMRVGAAQDMFKRGVELARIIKAGRWSNESMPIRYGRGHIADGATSEILDSLL